MDTFPSAAMDWGKLGDSEIRVNPFVSTPIEEIEWEKTDEVLVKFMVYVNL